MNLHTTQVAPLADPSAIQAPPSNRATNDGTALLAGGHEARVSLSYYHDGYVGPQPVKAIVVTHWFSFDSTCATGKAAAMFSLTVTEPPPSGSPTTSAARH